MWKPKKAIKVEAGHKQLFFGGVKFPSRLPKLQWMAPHLNFGLKNKTMKARRVMLGRREEGKTGVV